MTQPNAQTEPRNYGYDFEDIIITDYSVNFGLTWKNIIFLPFYRPMVYIFILVVYFSIALSLCVLTFQPNGDLFDGVIFTITALLDLVFLVRTLLAILHQIFKEHRKRKIFEPEPFYLLALDVFTLLPVGPYCFLINRYNWYDPIDSRIANYYCAALKLPRFVHLIYLFKKVYGDLSRHPRTLVIISHYMLSTLVVLCFSTAFYCYYYYTEGDPNWGDRYAQLHRYNVSYTTPILTIIYVSGFFYQDIVASIPLFPDSEKGLNTVTMLASYLAHTTYLTAALLAVYVQLMRFAYFYEWRLHKVATVVKLLGFEQSLQDSINTYYRTIWTTREGFVEQPDIIRLFPAQLKTEIAMDLYYDAIRHSLHFAKLSDMIKKELCLLFTTEIYIPGQFIFQKEKIKDKLMYIHSGIVEVMSNDNPDSPVLSFSPGTILCEVSSVMPYKCSADIRCSTACVIHLLPHRSLTLLLSRHKSLNSQVRKTIAGRLAYAQKKIPLAKKQDIPMSHICWIKYRWRQLIKVATTVPKPEWPPEPLSKYFCTRYLNLLVISSRYELKVHAICIRGQCSFVMEPESSFRRFLEIFVMICEVIHFFITFHMIIFEGRIKTSMYAVLSFFDLIYLLDIYLQAITAVRVRNVFISEPMDILVYKCKQLSFLIDIFASLPYDYFALITGTAPYYVGMCRLPKYIRLYKVIMFFTTCRQTRLFSPRTMKTFQLVVSHSLIILTCACIVYTWTCYENNCRPDGWLSLLKKQAQKELQRPLDTPDFVISLTYTASLYLRMKIHHVLPVCTSELIAEYLISMLGFYLINQTLVQMAGAIALENYPRFLYMIQLNYYESVFQERPELREFRSQIREFISMQWNYSKNMQLTDVINLMNHKSEFLTEKINHDFIIANLKKTRLFVNYTNEFLQLLANYTYIYVVPSGHVLQKRATRALDLYVVLDGYCHVSSSTAGDQERRVDFFYGKDDVFPVIGFFHDVLSFLNVETYTVVKVLCISRHDFQKCIKAMSVDRSIQEKVLKEHLNQNRTAIMRIVHWPVLHYPKPTPRSTVPTFQYRTDQDVSEQKRRDNLKLWMKIFSLSEFRANVRYIFLATYDPHGKYIFYELFRAVVIVSEMVCLYLSLHKSIRFSLFYAWMTAFLLVSHVVDIYIRCHVQYYTPDGIRVSNPRSTCRYYLTNSFLIDLISALPYEKIKAFDIIPTTSSNWMNVIISLIVQPLKLYRPFLLLIYLRRTICINYHNYLLTLTSTLILITCFCQLGAFALTFTCTVNTAWEWECPPDSWLHSSEAYQFWNSRDLIYSRVLREMVSFRHLRATRCYTYHDFVLFLFIGLVLCGVYIWYFATLIGYGTFSAQYYINMREEQRRYSQLASKLGIPKRLQDELVEYHKYLFKKTRSDEWNSSMILNMYPHLRECMQHAMYTPTLREASLFSRLPTHVYNFMGQFFTERFYTVNALLLQCNDINEYIYLVKKGTVEIFIADQSVGLLGVGGAFGCFSRSGASRCSIKVVAVVNTDVLAIKTRQFYDVVQPYRGVTVGLQLAHRLNKEFFKSFSELNDKPSGTVRQRYSKFAVHRWFCYTFDNSGRLIKAYSIFTNMHLASLTSILALVMLVLETSSPVWIFWVAIDSYYFLSMYMSSHISYSNRESGLKTTKVQTLTKMYLKSWKFAVDLIAILPLYYFHTSMVYKGIHLYYLNKPLRIINMIMYYNLSLQTSYLSTHVRITFLTYIMFYFLTLNVLLVCLANLLLFDIDTAIQWKHLLLYCTNVVTIFTTTGLFGEFNPWFTGFCFVTGSVIFLNLVLVLLNTGFCKLAVMVLYCDMDFRRAVIMFKRYCHNENVSRPSVNQCWYYLMHLYARHGKEQFSSLITNSPNYIFEAHMSFIAEPMICLHDLFKNAHVDFVRQLMRYVRYEFIMPGSTIVEEGDKRKSMFFVAEGQVLSIDKSQNEDVFKVLTKGDSFGDVQAISGTQFLLTYKALTSVQLFTIRTREWAYLLRWFPATKKNMFDVIAKLEKCINMQIVLD